MYAHKLTTYEDAPRVMVVFCSVCGQDSDLAGSCPGAYQMSDSEQIDFDNQFRAIFNAPVKVSRELKNKLRCT